MAYSYLRFSSPEQMRGDSFRRQTELSQKYADEHGLQLDQSLTFHDLGVSAFRGKNVDEGALGAFLQAVDEGYVPAGSVLLVESLDRLSRDKVWNAVNRLADILKRDITVVTLQDRREYTVKSLDNISELLVSLLYMSRAHEESATKSKRVRAAWGNKRKRAATEGHKLTARCPAWLRLNRQTGTFEVIEERADLVRRIFRMALDGIGKVAICHRLNAEEVPTFGRSHGWHESYVRKILDNEAVVGRFQPMKTQVDPATGKSVRVPDGEPIDDYFPSVIDRPSFLKVRAMRQTHAVPGGRRGKCYSNLFTGLAVCSSCGSPMHYIHKGNNKKKHTQGGDYLVCSAVRRRMTTCRHPAWRYKAVEYGMVFCLHHLRWSELFPDLSRQSTDAVKKLQDRKLMLEDDIKRTEAQIQKAIDALLDDTPSAALKQRLLELEAQQGEQQDELQTVTDQLTSQLVQANDTQSGRIWTEVQALLRWLKVNANSSPDERYEVRARMNALLKRQGVRIIFEPAGGEPEVLKGEVHGRVVVEVGEQTAAVLVVRKGQQMAYTQLKGVTVPVPLTEAAARTEEMQDFERALTDALRTTEGERIAELTEGKGGG